jgi:Domain of unknown function (DUF4423)
MKADAPYELIASELIRAARGRRSQTGLSRRIGYRSNVVHRWEAGQSWPTASGFLKLCQRLRIDVRRSFTRFYLRPPSWIEGIDPTSPAAVAAFLHDLQGRTPIKTLAASAGYNRYSVSRWLKGSVEPRLPEFLCLIEASSRRLLDYVATLTDPARLPCLEQAWTELTQAREAAYDAPWSHAVLRVLELEGAHVRASDLRWVAQKLGIAESEVAGALQVLQRTGQVRAERGRLRVQRVIDVDTSREPERARRLKAVWTRVAMERLERGAPGLFGYRVFAVSRSGLRRLRELQLEYVSAMQAVVAEPQASECVGLYCAQLLDLEVGPANALAR